MLSSNCQVLKYIKNQNYTLEIGEGGREQRAVIPDHVLLDWLSWAGWSGFIMLKLSIVCC